MGWWRYCTCGKRSPSRRQFEADSFRTGSNRVMSTLGCSPKSFCPRWAAVRHHLCARLHHPGITGCSDNLYEEEDPQRWGHRNKRAELPVYNEVCSDSWPCVFIPTIIKFCLHESFVFSSYERRSRAVFQTRGRITGKVLNDGEKGMKKILIRIFLWVKSFKVKIIKNSGIKTGSDIQTPAT